MTYVFVCIEYKEKYEGYKWGEEVIGSRCVRSII